MDENQKLLYKQLTKKHPYGKGAANLSIEELLKRGRRYDGGQSWKEVAAQLQEQANLRDSEGRAGMKFKKAAEAARAKAHKEKEYKEDRKKKMRA